MRNTIKAAAAWATSTLALTAASTWLVAAYAQDAKGGAAKPDANKGQQIVTQVCAACHGADGNSTSPVNPKLAAQHPDYLLKQLKDFKAEGGKPAERVNAVMAAFAQPLSEADMRNVSAYYSSQKLKPAFAKLKDSVELGQKIYRGGIASKAVPACSGCHSPNGAGIPAQFPRLAGQYADYTEAQLVLFRQGGRKNSPQMTPPRRGGRGGLCRRLPAAAGAVRRCPSDHPAPAGKRLSAAATHRPGVGISSNAAIHRTRELTC